MHIFNDDPQESFIEGINKLKGYAKKYNWTAFEQQAILQALRARINLRDVFENAFLEQNFSIDENASRANLSNLNPSIISNTESLRQSETMSRV